jgi:hypothetical protein
MLITLQIVRDSVMKRHCFSVHIYNLWNYINQILQVYCRGSKILSTKYWSRFYRNRPWQQLFKVFIAYKIYTNKQTPWSESASELHRPSDRRLSANWLPTFVDRRCHVVSVTDPYGCILGFLDLSRYYFFQIAPQLYSTIPGTTRKKSSGSVTGSTQPRDYNWGAIWKK